MIFCILSSIVELLDRNYYNCHPLIEIFLVAISVFYLIKPTQLWRFYIATITQIIVAIYSMPAVGNHVLFKTIVGAYFISELSIIWYKTKKFPNFGDSFENRMIKNLQFFILSLYFFATLHKLNTDYFNPSLSCAKDVVKMAMGSTLPFKFPPISSFALSNFLIWASIIVEFCGPLLLTTKRGFKLGLTSLFLLHLFLGTFVIDFNFLTFAYLSLFLSYETIEKNFNNYKTKLKRLSVWKINLIFLIFITLCLNFKFSFQTLTINRYLKMAMNDALFLCLFALVLPFFISAIKDRTPSNSSIKVSLVAFPFMLLWIIAGLGPYLGYKNITAGAMYSNLRVEGSTNHLFIPKGSLQISDEIDRLINVPIDFFQYLHYQRVSFTIPYRFKEKLFIQDYEMGRIAHYFKVDDTNQKSVGFSNFIQTNSIQDAKKRYIESSWWKKKTYAFRPFFNEKSASCSW